MTDAVPHQTIKDKIAILLRLHGNTAANGSRRISPETTHVRAKTLFMIVDQLKEGGFDVHDLKKLQPKHLQYLATRWENEGLAAGTMQNRWSLLKTVLEKWLNRQGVIKPLASYLAKPEGAVRTYIAQEDKSWCAKVEDVDKLITIVSAKDRYVGNQLKMMKAFGLRRKEAVMFKPRIHELGDYIVVTESTKGGRQRTVNVATPAQRALLDDLKSQCSNRLDHLGNPKKNLQQNLARFNNVVRSLGICRANMGITSHGLRHQFANDLVEELSGQPTPVRSGQLPIDKEKFEDARLVATLALGHGRTSITAAYHGSVKKPVKDKNDGITPPKRE